MTKKKNASPVSNKTKNAIDQKSSASVANRQATFTTDILEPRILMSATWVDASTDQPEVEATDGNDTGNGSSMDDVLNGLGGDDTLFGNGGNDQLFGGTGDDELFGGEGNDQLSGGAGSDVLEGQAGNDTITGGSGNDVLVGGDGDDKLSDETGRKNFIQNGSFEKFTGGDIAAGGWRGFKQLEGWKLESGPQFEVVDSQHMNVGATDGEHWLDTDASPGGITFSQKIDGLADGESYELNFDSRSRGAEGTAVLEVYWNGEKVGTTGGTLADGWKQNSFELVSGSGDGTNTLRFSEIGRADALGTALDNVSLVAINDDTLVGGSGNDELNGGEGDDVLIGDNGDGDSTNLVTDGGFSKTGVTNQFQTLREGQPFSGWKVESGTVDVIGTYWEHNGASGSIDLDGSSPGAISQVMATVPGVTYTVRFDMAGNCDGGLPTKGLELSVGDTSKKFEWSKPAGWSRQSMGYETREFTFVADSESSKIVFASQTQPNAASGPYFGAVITKISVSPTIVRQGDDLLNGGAGNDQLFGNGGNDTLDGGTGNDRLFGGAGNDRILGGSGSDRLDGGSGFDTASYQNSNQAIVADLTTGTVTSGKDVDTLASIERIEGSAFDDTFAFSKPTPGANYSIDGGSGYNTIDLTRLQSAKIGLSGNQAVVSLPDGNNFTIEFANVDFIKTSDGGFAIYDADAVENVRRVDLSEVASKLPESIVTKAGQSFALPLNLSGVASSEGVEVRVSGLPSGAKLSAGREVGPDEWLLMPSELEKVSLTTDKQVFGSFDVQVAASMEGAKPLFSENFEGGAKGWNVTTSEATSSLSQTLGRFGGTKGEQGLFKTFAVPEGVKEVVVEFDFLEIDTWDGEQFQVFANNKQVSAQTFFTEWSAYQRDGNKSDSIAVDDGSKNQGFSGWADQRHSYRIVMPVENGFVKVGFGSTLDQAIDDESWAIDNLLIHANHSIATTIAVEIEPAVSLQMAAQGDLADGPVRLIADASGSDGGILKSVRVENVPASMSLSAGTRMENGAWALTPEQLSNLQATGELQGTADLTIRSTFETKGTLYSEDFEKGASGWSSNLATQGDRSLTSFLGGFGDMAGVERGSQAVFKTYYAPSGVSEVQVEFDFLEIDSWDGEQFRVFANDKMVSAQSFFTEWSAYKRDDNKADSIALDDGTKNQGLSGWADQRHRYAITIPVVNGQFKVGFGSTLDQGPGDESWGVDNLKVSATRSIETISSVTINSRQVLGTTGNDSFVASAKAESFIGKDGNDTVDYSKSAQGVTVKLDDVDSSGPLAFQKAGGMGGDAAGDSYKSIENVIGSSRNDTIYGAATGSNVKLGAGDDVFDNNQSNVARDVVDGGDGDDTISTGNGSDLLIGGKGNDKLFGEDGNDVLNGGAGNDQIDGGVGFDRMELSGRSSDYSVVRNANGTWTVTDLRPGSPDGIDQVSSIETLAFQDAWLPMDTVARNVEPIQLVSASAEPNQLTVRLGGEMGNSAGQKAEPPRYEVWANGQKIATGVVDWAKLDRIGAQTDAFRELKFDVAPGQQLSNVSIRFTNDAYEGKAATDRILYVDAIEVNGTKFEAEGPQTQFHRGQDQIKGQEAMYWSGTLSFNTASAARPTDAHIAENTAGAVIGRISAANAKTTFEVSDERFEVKDGTLKLKDGVSLNYEETSSIDLKVTATSGKETWTRSVHIGVDNVNEGPSTGKDSFSVTEDSTLKLNANQLLANDFDVDGDKLTIIGVSDAQNGTVKLLGNGQIEFTANANYSGPAKFSYTVTDADGLTSTATVEVNVAAAADAANVVASDVSGFEDQAVALNLSASLTDTDGSEVLSVSIKGVPEGFSLSNGTRQADGSWNVAPSELSKVTLSAPKDFNGQVQLTVDATTTESGSGSIAVVSKAFTVNVADVNDAPYEIKLDNTTILEKAGSGDLVARLSATDVDDFRLTYRVLGEGATSFTIVGNELRIADGAKFDAINRPTETVTIEVSDGRGGVATRELKIAIENVNDAAITENDRLVADEDTPLVIDANQLLANDFDVDGDKLTIIGVSDAQNGTVKLLGNGQIEFTANANYSGPAKFSYTVTDADGLTSTATVEVNVAAAADAANVVASDVSGFEDQAVALNLSASLTDTDGSEVLSVSIKGVPEGFSLSNGTRQADGSWNVAPSELSKVTLSAPKDFNGQVQLTVDATTTESGSGSIAVVSKAFTVNVADVNDQTSELEIAKKKDAWNQNQVVQQPIPADGSVATLGNATPELESVRGDTEIGQTVRNLESLTETLLKSQSIGLEAPEYENPNQYVTLPSLEKVDWSKVRFEELVDVEASDRSIDSAKSGENLNIAFGRSSPSETAVQQAEVVLSPSIESSTLSKLWALVRAYGGLRQK